MIRPGAILAVTAEAFAWAAFSSAVAVSELPALAEAGTASRARIRTGKRRRSDTGRMNAS
jgi:hypothetical protein